jgi:hypothetical protein
MTRSLAFLAALLLAAISVSSACMAGSTFPIPFTLSADRADQKVQLNLSRSDGTHHGSMSSSLVPSELIGLDIAAVRMPGQRPIQFALVKDAGRLDCSGAGGDRIASGRCSFALSAAFADFLASRGIARPTAEQAYGLTMTGATRDLVDALSAYHYPKPSIDDLTALSALGVSRRFIADLTARGFAPKSLDYLTTFAALDITPPYIDSLAAAGYRNLDADEIVQFKALGITPAFIAGFAQAGFANLDVDTLVQLKALNVTPEFVRSLEQHGLHPKTADQLVKLKVAGLDE